MEPQIREILASVDKPWRYIGGEVGSVVRDWQGADVRVCLAFPEVYEIGMSHVGLAILYHILNAEVGMLAERAFAPWLDMEAELRRRGLPLFSLESGRPLRDFDIVGISLGYELTFTNVLSVLSLAGIPLRASARGDGDPIVIGGGPCAFNPEPVADFFDAIVIGDGEGAIVELANRVRAGKRAGLSRADTLRSLTHVKGVYLPGSDRAQPVGMARVADLDAAAFPAQPLSPYAATQERVAVEVARGCARGCRFCQAGYAYRPVRQREAATAAKLALSGIASSGKEEFSFLSLSVSDWPPLEGALAQVHAGCGGMEVKASLPSLRVEALSDGIVSALGRSRSGSFTLAPEAATERMRRMINKGNTDEDLYASVEKVFAGGWKAIKLYFMLGLPGETDEDVEGIVAVANRCLDVGKKYFKRPDVTVSTSTFVPKAHTPFQWDAQISVKRTLELQGVLKRRLRRPGLYYRWHKAQMSFLEGVFARGGRELAAVLETAFQKGARFDGWDERFDGALWREAFQECGIEPEAYLRGRDHGEALPWEHLGVGPSRAFLIAEREKAEAFIATPDCTTGACSNCGICDFTALKNRLARNLEPGTRDSERPVQFLHSRSQVPDSGSRYRIHFTKIGRAVFLGQIETLDILRRAMRAARLPLAYSDGYHPRAKIASGPALPLGVESLAEFADAELTAEPGAEDLERAINAFLPEGLRIISLTRIDTEAPAIDDATAAVRYEVRLQGDARKALAAIARFHAASALPFTRVRREKRVEVDVKTYIAGLAEVDEGVVGLSVLHLKPALKISEIVAALFDITDAEARKLSVRKVAVEWK